MQRTKRELERFVKVSELKIPVTFQVEFDRPVPIREARQIARRVLDHTGILTNCEIENDAFAEAKFKCSQLQRVIKLAVRD